MMIYILSVPIFHRDSESEVRTSKFHQRHMICPCLYFIPILVEFNLHQSWWSIYHLGLLFAEIPNSKSEIYKSISEIHIWHISVQYIVECSRFKKGLGYIHRSHRYNHMSVMQHTCVYQYIINGSIYLQYLSLPTQKRQLSYMYHQSSNWVSDNITEGLYNTIMY